MPTSTQRFRLVGEDDASRAFLEVAAAAKLLKSNMDDVSTSALGLTRLMGTSSLIPVLAGAAAATANLTTALGLAAGAGATFGLSAGSMVASMLKQQQAINSTSTTLSTLVKGTTSYTNELQKLHTQQAIFNKLFGPAATSFNRMKKSFQDFQTATGPVTKGVLAKGFQLVASVLPKLVPVSNAAGRAVGGLIGDLENWTKGPGFANLLYYLKTEGPRDITAFGHIFGNVLGGIGGILSNFVGPGRDAAATLERMSHAFDKWGNGAGPTVAIHGFLKYVSDNGPELSSTFKALATAAPKIATALGGIGSMNLSVTSRFLTLIAGLPQKQFTLIADGLFAIAAGSKALTLVTGLAGAASALVAIGKSGAGILAGKGIAGKAGGAAGGILGGKGVVPVYVTNKGWGGPGGGGPGGGEGPTGMFGRFGKYFGYGAGAGAEGAATAGFAAAGAAAAALLLTSFIGYIQRNIKPYEADPKSPYTARGGPAAARYYGHDPSAASAPRTYGRGIVVHDAVTGYGSVKAIANGLDSIRQKAGKASQALELIGPHAAATSKKTVAAIQALNGRSNGLDSIKQHAGIASQNIEMIGPHAQQGSSMAVAAITRVNSQLMQLHDRKIKITADTSQAMANLAVMRAQVDALHNKTIIIRAIGGHVTDNSQVGGGSGGGGSSTGAHSMGSGPDRGYYRGAPTHVSWWQGTGAHLLRTIVGPGKISPSNLINSVRAARQTDHQRLQATLGNRNAYAAGFQSFASSAFGANYGQDAAGNDITPTIDSILQYAGGQASQAAMVKTDVRKLVKLGLSPALLKQLQAAGQAGIPEIQALAGASRSQIAQYNALNKQTTGDLRAAGMSAGNRIWGQQIRQERQDSRAVQHLLKMIHDELKNHPDRLVAQLKGDHIDLVLASERRKKGHLQSDKKP